MKRFCFGMLVCLFAAPAFAQEPAPESVRQRIAFANVRVRSALSVLGKNLKMEVEYDNAVRNEMLEMELDDVSIPTAMTVIFKRFGLRACLIEEKTIFIYPDTEAARGKYAHHKPWPAVSESEK
jgi:hypothetical protein